MIADEIRARAERCANAGILEGLVTLGLLAVADEIRALRETVAEVAGDDSHLDRLAQRVQDVQVAIDDVATHR